MGMDVVRPWIGRDKLRSVSGDIGWPRASDAGVRERSGGEYSDDDVLEVGEAWP